MRTDEPESEPSENGDTPYMGVILGQSLKNQIKEIAQREERSMGAVIRILLREALEHRNCRPA